MPLCAWSSCPSTSQALRGARHVVKCPAGEGLKGSKQYPETFACAWCPGCWVTLSGSLDLSGLPFPHL